jgi:hypothetical protein
MRRASVVLLIAVQLAVFLGTLGLGIAGTLSGEAAGCLAILAWFIVGLPSSYAAADYSETRLARREAGRRGQLAPIQARGTLG